MQRSLAISRHSSSQAKMPVYSGFSKVLLSKWNVDLTLCLCSVNQLCLTLCDPKDCSTPGFPVLHHLPELTQTQCPLSQWCHPTILSSVIPFSSCLQSFPASGSFLMSWLFAKCSSFSFSISPSSKYSELISFRIHWFDLLAIQETLKSLLQHHSSILQCSAFFKVQLSHPYMTNRKVIALTIWTFKQKL